MNKRFPVPRLWDLRSLMIKIERDLSVNKIKKMLGTAMDHFNANPENRSLLIQVDVDPV